jgi:RHS repeat-associated protein
MFSPSRLIVDRIIRILVVITLVFSATGGAPVRAMAAQTDSANQPNKIDSPVWLKPLSDPAASTTLQSPLATPDDAVTDSSTLTTEPGSSTALTITITITYAPPLTATQITVNQSGGHAASIDNRIQLDVPPGLFKNQTQVSITPRRIDRSRDPQGMLVSFELEAIDQMTGAKIAAFEQPITLTLDLNGLIDKSQLKPNEHLALFHETDNPDAPWAEIVNPVEIQPGVLQTRLSHFSGSGGGSSGDAPAGWQLTYNPPDTSLFSGAATYNFPIAVAPGVHGLQPSINLAYSSRSVDGLLKLEDKDIDGLPVGWSMDMASINRDRTKVKYHPSWVPPVYTIDLYPTFSLALNGSNYDLVPAVANQWAGRYYAKDLPSLYIERRNDTAWNGSPDNVSHEYWIVKTGDGTTYRFGYNSDSEQNYTITPRENIYCYEGGYCGAAEASGTATSRWRVDLITDILSNQMVISYTTTTTEDNANGEAWGALTTEHTHVDEMRYDYINGAATSRVVFSNTTGAQNWFDRIQIYHAGLTNKVREYQLGWSGGLTTLLSITQTDSTGSQALPATTFTSSNLVHGLDLDDLPIYMPYMLSVSNGYGGRTEFSYQSDGRAEIDQGVYVFGYSYVVTETRTYDGLTVKPAIVRYTYDARCYDQWGNAALIKCTATDSDKFGPLVGHGVVTETVLNDAGTAASISRHYFYGTDGQPAHTLRGKEYSSQTYDSNGTTLLTSSDSVYASAPMPGGTTFTFLTEAYATTYSGGSTLTTRTDYAYDAYGNQTAQYAYGAEERVINAGFEAGSSDWSLFWSPTPASLNTTVRFAGQNSLQLQGGSNGGADQDISGLISGTTYLIRAWVMATAGATAKFQLWAHDTTGANSVTSAASTPTTVWTLITLPYQANATGAVRIHLYYLAGGGTIYVDEVALAKAADVGDERTTQTGFYPLTTIAAIPTVTYYTAVSATAKSNAGGAGAATDNNLNTWWDSDYLNGPNHPQWIEFYLSTPQPIDIVRFVQDDWPASNLAITYGPALTSIGFSTYNDGSNYTVFKLANVITTTRIRLTANTLGGDGDPYYYFLVEEIQAGKTPASANTGQWIVDKMAFENMYAGISQNVGGSGLKMQTINYYDNNPSWSTPPTKGLLTAARQGLGSLWVSTKMAYDQWGNPIVVTDTLNHTTTTAYDGLYHLYPVQTTNALGQSTQMGYDYKLGVPLTVTDPNGAQTTMAYDGFGRLMKVFKPGDGSDPSTQYNYSDTRTPAWVAPLLITEWHKPATTGTAIRHFYDGLGREIQTHSAYSVSLSGYSTPQDIIVSQAFDARGLVAYQTVPYAAPAYVYNAAAPVNPYTTVNMAAAPKTLTAYDALGRTTVITAPDATVVKMAYAGLQTALLDANGHQRLNQTDIFGQLIAVKEYAGTFSAPTFTATAYATTTYDYDVLGNLVVVTDALQNTTVITYNVLGQKTEMRDPDMGKWKYQYDLGGNLITQTDALGRKLIFNYDPLNRLLSKSTGVAYDYDGQSTARTEAENYSSQAGSVGADYKSFASNGQVLGQSWGGSAGNYAQYDGRSFGWTGHTTVLHLRYANAIGHGNNLQVYVDGVYKGDIWADPTTGWGWSLTDFHEAALNLGAIAPGNHSIKFVTPSAGSNTNLDYFYFTDGDIGRRVSMSDPSGSESWNYDVRGRVITDSKMISNAGTFKTSFGYDGLDRVLTTTYPTGEVVTQTYNAMGALENLRSISAPQSYNQWYVKNLDYNANGSIAKLDLGNNVTTKYGYFGFTANQWDGRPSPGLYQYGRLWRTRVEAPSGQALQDLRYAYDNVGNIAYITDAPRAITGTLNTTLTDNFTTKNTSLWTYDTYQTVPFTDTDGNRVVKNTGDGSTWNADFVRTQYAIATNGGAQVRFKVDSASSMFVLALENNDATYRRLGIYGHNGYVTAQYTDNNGVNYREPTTLIPALQANVWYTLTIAVDDVRGLTLDVVSQTQHSTYNIFLASGKTWHFHAWTLSGSMYLDDYKEFNSGAQITPDERMQFTYDSLDRLTQALTTTIDGYTGTYTYNPIGNLMSKSEGAGAINYTYGVTQPHAVRSLSNGGLYQYDLNGNMSLRVELSGSQRITYTQQWDSENRLTVVTNTAIAPNVISKFIYDGDGARVMQLNISGTQIITTAYAGAIEMSITATQRITKAYYSAGSQLIAMRVITASGSALFFMSSDHLGSASLTTDANGGFVARQKFDAWGNVRASASSGSMGTDISFTGQRSNSEIGLLFFNARFYDASLGRFLSADTIVPDSGDPQQYNRFAYATNNPLKYTDPSGHCRIVNGNYEYAEDCTIDEFNSLNWQQRRDWLQTFVDNYKLGSWFNDILGVIDMLSGDRNLSNLNGYTAHVDAASLQGIQDGMRMKRGLAAIGRDYGDGQRNNGGGKWAQFFRNEEQMHKLGDNASDSLIESTIAIRVGAEQEAITYGRDYATKLGLHGRTGFFENIKITILDISSDVYRSNLPWDRLSYRINHPYTSSQMISSFQPGLDPRTSWEAKNKFLAYGALLAVDISNAYNAP